MAEKSERTKRLEEAKIEDDPLYFKRAIRGATLGMSRAADKMGIGKDKKEEPVKKAKGGSVRYQEGGYVEPNYAFNDEPQKAAPGGVTLNERQPPLNTNLLNIGTAAPQADQLDQTQMRRGGRVKKKAEVKSYKPGGKVSSASKRGDGCAQRGKTKGRMV